LLCLPTRQINTIQTFIQLILQIPPQTFFITFARYSFYALERCTKIPFAAKRTKHSHSSTTLHQIVPKKQRRLAHKKGLPPGTIVYTGSKNYQSIVKTVNYTFEVCQTFPLFKSEYLQLAGNLWVDVRGVNEVTTVRQIGERFNIHPLALEDVVNTQQRAKLDEYDNGIFVVLPHLKLDADHLELVQEQITVFFNQHQLVSFQEDPDDTFVGIMQRLTENAGRLRRQNTDYLAIAIADAIVDNYLETTDQIENLLIGIENDIYANVSDHKCKNRIYQLKSISYQFRQRVQPLREALMRIARLDTEFIDATNLVYLRDVVDHLSIVLDQLENFRDHLANLDTLLMAEASNRMNNVMKLLTTISTIFIPLSFVAGVYGMNFDYMPELKWRYGYFIVLGFMLSIMVGMLAWFYRKRWI
jgi:magnesium transporter